MNTFETIKPAAKKSLARLLIANICLNSAVDAQTVQDRQPRPIAHPEVTCRLAYIITSPTPTRTAQEFIIYVNGSQLTPLYIATITQGSTIQRNLAHYSFHKDTHGNTDEHYSIRLTETQAIHLNRTFSLEIYMPPGAPIQCTVSNYRRVRA